MIRDEIACGIKNFEADLLNDCLANNVPGHNQSILYALEIFEEINAQIYSPRSDYRGRSEYNVEINGLSGALYRIQISVDWRVLCRLDRSIEDLIERGESLEELLSAFSPLIFNWSVEAYSSSDFGFQSWKKICLRSAKVPGMVHVMDQIASIALALHDDLNSALMVPELQSLRNYLLANSHSNWLMGGLQESMTFTELTSKLALLRGDD